MRPFVSVPLKYGVIAGFLSAFLAIGLYYMGRHPFLIPVYFDFRIFVLGVFIFFTLKELRDLHYDGVLYFWQGILCSFLFTAIFGTAGAITIMTFAWIVPEFLQSYITLSMEQIKSLPADVIDRIGKEVYQRNLELLPATSEFDLGILYFIQSFMISFFITIILSVILRREPKS